MMGSFLDFIKSSKELLKNSLSLCESLESKFLANDVNNDIMAESLNEMSKNCKKLKTDIFEAKKIEVKTKRLPNKKNQNGDFLKESKNANKTSVVTIKESGEKIKNGHSEVDIDDLNNAAKEAILNGSDSESLLESSTNDVLSPATDNPNLSDIVIKGINESNEENSKNNDENSCDQLDFDDSEKLHIVLDEKGVDFDFKSPDDIFIKDSNTKLNDSKEAIEISDEEMSTLKECYVLLQDLATTDNKDNTSQDFFSSLDKEVNKLSQIPKLTIKKSTKIDIVNKKATVKEKCTSKSSAISVSDSDDNDDDIESVSKKSKSASVELELSNPTMADSPLSSSESSSEASKDDFKPHKNRENLRNRNVAQRRITRSLRIPLSDSEESQKSALRNGKSMKRQKRSNKEVKSIISVSSVSEEESDASASALRKQNKKRPKATSKGRSKKQKLDSEDERKKNRDETRKNIHKIITQSKLSEATKAAEQLEMERRKRMEEKQEMYNKSMLKKDDSSINDKAELILEKNAEGEAIVAVHKHISDQLKIHQIEAVNFMYDCVIESVECLLNSQKDKNDEDKSSSSVGGCILAHCMGLGKTLALIAFVHTMLTTPIMNMYTCIVVCPANTALNWKKEWEMWMPADRPIKIFEVNTGENRKYKISIVQDWQKKGGILIIGYEMFRLLALGDNRTIRTKALRQKMQEALLDPGADFVVCDEGHLLKNEKSALNKVVNKVKTKHRIILTGTPLQNRLPEYHTMVNFVKPNLLGTHKEFLNRFVNPISNGQHIDSTPYDVKVMKKRSHILFKTLDGCVHRRDYSALVKYLPPKYEYIIKIRLTEIQMQLYRAYLGLARVGRHTLFMDQQSLARIMTHPFVVCMHQEIKDKKMFLADSDDESFIDDDSDEDSENNFKITSNSSKKQVDENNVINLLSDDGGQESNNDDKANNDMEVDTKEKENKDSENSSVEEVVKNWSSSTRSTRRNKLTESDDEPKMNFELENLKETPVDKHWFSEIIKPEHEHQIEISSKLVVLFQILRKAGDIGDKVILFSHSLLVLDIIEKYLFELNSLAEKVNFDLQKLNESISDPIGSGEAVDDQKPMEFFSNLGYHSWTKGIDYDRMDGSTHVITRSDIMNRFNSETEPQLRLFLISTKAGGMGVNLVAANRVVIFDVSWNPSHDIQAIFRSYRFGQNKPVYVYRLVSQGTIEERMYERQVTKQSLSLRVVDEQQISRHFTEEDLKSLYKFEPDIYDAKKERETPILPKDRFLAEMIQEFPQWIFSYHEHDSLLENKDEEELTESERQEAWKEFEDEKLHGTRPMNNPVHVNIDANQFAQAQMSLMMQQYPQYATIYSQNYMNLLRYVLSQQPELKYNPAQLSMRMQSIFFLSLQKYKESNPTANITANNVTTVATVTTAATASSATDDDVVMTSNQAQ